MNEDELKEFYITAAFGKQVEQFLGSDIGMYLCAKAQGEAEDAMEALLKCDPFQPEEVLKHQTTVRRAEGFRKWLMESVNEGLSALQIIEDREHG